MSDDAWLIGSSSTMVFAVGKGLPITHVRLATGESHSTVEDMPTQLACVSCCPMCEGMRSRAGLAVDLGHG